MKLVLLRHATRSALDLEAGPAGESPLNTIGLAQAEDLPNHVHPKGALPVPTKLIVSPKLRARQTLTPLSRETGLSLEVDPRLDERHSNESLQDFHSRVLSVFNEVQELALSAQDQKNERIENEVYYLCSHLDWLEAALTLWDTNLSDREVSTSWSPLDYQVFRFRESALVSLHRGSVHPRF